MKPPRPIVDTGAFDRKPSEDFDGLEAAGIYSSTGIWSDGVTMWVVYGEWIYAYDLASKARIPGKDFDIETLQAAGNRDPYGIWSDGETMWVADRARIDPKIYAYDLASKARVPGKDFDSEILWRAGNRDPGGIWSDGVTMWVAGSGKIYAYDMTTKARIPGKEFETLRAAGNWSGGIWSDGVTMWVSHPDFRNPKIYAYNMPASGGLVRLPEPIVVVD